MRTQLRAASAALLLAALAPAGVHPRVQAAPPVAGAAGAREAYGRLPLTFEENRGQTDPAVQYFARGPGYTVFLTSGEAVVTLRHNTVVRMTLAGAARAPHAVPADRRPGTSNYLLGNDPAQWRQDVPSYSRIRYEQVYPGIDLVYYGNQRQLEYDFEVAPAADPRLIQLDFSGADTVSVTPDGDLVLGVGRDSVRFHKPVTYQPATAGRRVVESRYVLNGSRRVGFEIADYDATLPLVIDPILSYSTYFGGGSEDYAFAIAVDPAGNAYVTGATNSIDFPTTTGAYSRTRGTNTNVTPPFGDAFVVKLNPAGSLVYSTYIGGSTNDTGNGIAVDSAGNAYVTGGTSSTNFPTTGGSFQPNWGNFPFASNGDAFVLKLNPAGSALVYSSFLSGGSLAEGFGIAVDSAGSAYVTGHAFFDFPTTNPLVKQFPVGSDDIFIAKFTPSGSGLSYSRLLGGSSSEEGYGIAVDTAGNAYITGYTLSANFAVVSAAQATYGGARDAIVARLNTTGGVVYSTFLGGDDLDIGGAIAVDPSGNAYVTGRAGSASFPVTAGAFQTTFRGLGNAFVTKLSPAGSFAYSTLLGGSLAENGTTRFETYGGIAVDGGGSAFVVGATRSNDFPLKDPIQPTNHGTANTDAFVARLNAAGSALVFSSFLGGDSSDHAYAVALDSSGFAYVAGVTSSANFPTASAHQAVKGTGGDLFITKIDPIPPPTVALDRTTLRFAAVSTGAAFSAQTGTQAVRLTKSGCCTVTWTASSTVPWLVVSPTSGTGTATLNVSVQFAAGLSATQTGSITLAFTGAVNTAGPISVTLNTVTGTSAAAPVGGFETPADNTTGVSGSIAVTGWAIDDVEVTRVRILRDPVAGEPAGQLVFIGNAVFVDGARPDVAQQFPSAPRNTRAGWGYLLLTNFLPTQGNGTFRLHAYADDADGHATLLGSKTIVCDNTNATRPFGAIDTPQQGDTVSGSINNFGWVLSRGTTRADPPSGGNVVALVDGVSVGAPGAWGNRSDLAALFPVAQYSGVNNALGVLGLDTTTLANGVHTIAWIVTDNVGGADGVGSRYFTVSNGSALTADAAGVRMDPIVLTASAALDTGVLAGRSGFDLHAPLTPFAADASGRFTVVGDELDRFELHLSDASGPGSVTYAGYLRAGAELWRLPIGSHLDQATGVFTWQPGVAFVGPYDFVFVRSASGVSRRRDVRILLQPKGSGRGRPQVAIDTPGPGEVAQPFVIAGWAADLDARGGTGVSTLHVWAYPVTPATVRRCDGATVRQCDSATNPFFLGAAAYGGRRPDVAGIYGPQYRDSGYGLTVEGLAPGTYDLAVFAWSTVTQAFVPAKVVRVIVANE